MQVAVAKSGIDTVSNNNHIALIDSSVDGILNCGVEGVGVPLDVDVVLTLQSEFDRDVCVRTTNGYGIVRLSG